MVSLARVTLHTVFLLSLSLAWAGGAGRGADSQAEMEKACESGSVAQVTYLIKSGTSVNQKLNEDKTCLILALELEHNELAKALIRTPKVDINSQAKNGETAIWVALESENQTLISELLKKGAQLSGKLSDSGDSILHLLARKGKLDLIKKNFASIRQQLNVQNALGETPLMVAVVFEQANVVEFLLKNKADRELKNLNQQTASDLAKRMKNKTIIKMLE